MEFHNLTPFPALAFEGIDQYDQEFHVIVMRATFDITSDLNLMPADEQAPLVVADQYFGEMNKGSVRQESDLAHYKPNCDVIINAAAYAPGGKPASSFNVGISISERSEQIILEKTLTVTGPRHWYENDKHWQLGEPEPISSLPLRYEYAYGGECRVEKDDPAAEKLNSEYLLTQEQRAEHPAGPDQAPAAHTACETNPIGMGFTEPWYLEATRPETLPLPQSHKRPIPERGFIERLIDRMLFMPPLPQYSGEASPTAESRKIPAPQIESPQDPITEFGRDYAPQGFGVITKAWLPRRKFGGTADEEFAQSDRWLPDDFDFAFWNGAHPDLQVPWLSGGERVELINLLPPETEGATTDNDGNNLFAFALPEEKPYLFIRLAGQGIVPCDLKIDTLLIDTECRKVALVYRTVLWKEPEIDAIAAKIINTKDRQVIDGWLNRSADGKEAVHG